MEEQYLKQELEMLRNPVVLKEFLINTKLSIREILRRSGLSHNVINISIKNGGTCKLTTVSKILLTVFDMIEERDLVNGGEHRYFDCVYYDNCLSKASINNKNFICDNCERYIKDECTFSI